VVFKKVFILIGYYLSITLNVRCAAIRVSVQHDWKYDMDKCWWEEFCCS